MRHNGTAEIEDISYSFAKAVPNVAKPKARNRENKSEEGGNIHKSNR